MRLALRTLIVGASAVIALAGPLVASAQPTSVATYDYTKNMKPLGELLLPNKPGGLINSDLAFWGKTAYQGTYDGFNIVDISDPENPVLINDYNSCSPNSAGGNQGDLMVWDTILIRSWNSPAGSTATCDGDVVPQGFEGLHIFDISNPLDPDLIGSVAMITTQPNIVTVNPPSSAAGTYLAAGANFGPAPTPAGVSGAFVIGNDGAGVNPTDGCEPYVVPAGSIAIVDRGNCDFNLKVANGQASGAVGVVVVNNVAGNPTTMGGTNPSITIPSVHVSQANGATIKAGLPATGTIAQNPVLQGCGSHTATLVPDLANDRLLVYNSGSSAACPGIDIVEVPLANPGAATWLRREPSGRSCHDTGVILGDVMRVACAGGNGFTMYSIDPADGATLTDPVQLYSRVVPNVSVGHTAAFSWDGEVFIFGHEPGGGTQPSCEATDPEYDRTIFFFEPDTGNEIGRWVMDRTQLNTENCTIHNLNVVPLASRPDGPRRVLVHGSYQSGIGVLDFSDPANAVEIAYADPAPLVPEFDGGDWSTYWYNGFIYESDITRGLIVWNLSDKAVAGAMKLPHLNPQTQEFSID